MFRDLTYSDVNRLEATGETRAEFVMDEDAFRGFYDRNARGVWAYLTRVTGDRQMADDLLQETFYRFLRADAAHDSEAHRRNSLYRIATNLARDARRRSLTRPAANVAGHDIEAVAGADRSGSAERSADFERAMSWLAYAEGASHREIADTLGLRPASLKQTLFRARRRLAVLLGRTEASDAAR